MFKYSGSSYCTDVYQNERVDKYFRDAKNNSIGMYRYQDNLGKYFDTKDRFVGYTKSDQYFDPQGNKLANEKSCVFLKDGKKIGEYKYDYGLSEIGLYRLNGRNDYYGVHPFHMMLDLQKEKDLKSISNLKDELNNSDFPKEKVDAFINFEKWTPDRKEAGLKQVLSQMARYPQTQVESFKKTQYSVVEMCNIVNDMEHRLTKYEPAKAHEFRNSQDDILAKYSCIKALESELGNYKNLKFDAAFSEMNLKTRQETLENIKDFLKDYSKDVAKSHYETETSITNGAMVAKQFDKYPEIQIQKIVSSGLDIWKVNAFIKQINAYTPALQKDFYQSKYSMPEFENLLQNAERYVGFHEKSLETGTKSELQKCATLNILSSLYNLNIKYEGKQLSPSEIKEISKALEERLDNLNIRKASSQERLRRINGCLTACFHGKEIVTLSKNIEEINDRISSCKKDLKNLETAALYTNRLIGKERSTTMESPTQQTLKVQKKSKDSSIDARMRIA